MGGDPVPVIDQIRDLLDIGRNRKNPREDYLGEQAVQHPSVPYFLRAKTLTLSLSPSDVYVFGVGPLVEAANINALASKKDNEQHVFRVKDMENLEDVFYQMIGRKFQQAIQTWQSALPRPHGSRILPLPLVETRPFPLLFCHCYFLSLFYFPVLATELWATLPSPVVLLSTEARKGPGMAS